MISQLFHQIRDADARLQYRHQTINYFSKLTPIATVIVGLLVISIEVIQRQSDRYAENILITANTVFNWSMVLLMVVLSILVRKFFHACMLVSPLLTGFCLYYFCIIDYEKETAMIGNVTAGAIILSYFLLVFAMENWVANAITSVPVFIVFTAMQHQKRSGLEYATLHEIIRCTFMVFIYSLTAWQIDRQNKRAFIGEQSTEETFSRWLQMFESFPEGVTLIRGENLLYANNQTRKQFGLHTVQPGQTMVGDSKHNNQSSVQKHFELQRIRMHQPNGATQPADNEKQQKITTVWEFIQGDVRVGTFEVLPIKGLTRGGRMRTDSAYADMSQDTPLVQTNNNANGISQASGDDRIFVQLRQVSVRMGGRNEKLIIITDESAKIHFEQIKHKGQHMQKFTEQMITQIDLYAGQASETIKEVYSHVSAEGLKFTETCQFELKKLRYHIRDYFDICSIANQDFTIKNRSSVQIKKSIVEVLLVVKNELMHADVEVNFTFHPQAPERIQVVRNLLNQVLINLLLETVKAIKGRGWIKLNITRKSDQDNDHLQIDFEASQFSFDKQEQLNMINVEKELELNKILQSNVQMTYKIPKILCNELNWKIKCAPQASSRYTLLIPIPPEGFDFQSQYSHATGQISQVQRPTTGGPISKSQIQTMQKQSNLIQDSTTNKHHPNNYEDLDQVDEGQRPFSALVQSTHSNNLNPKFNSVINVGIKPVKEEVYLENEIDSPSVYQNSTRTLGMDSAFRQKRIQQNLQAQQAAVQQSQERCLLMNFTELQLFEENQLLSCSEAFTEQKAIDMIAKALDEKAPYDFLIVDHCDEQARLNLDYLCMSLKEVQSKRTHLVNMNQLKIVVFYQSEQQDLASKCKQLDVQYVEKPQEKSELAQILGLKSAGDQSFAE